MAADQIRPTPFRANLSNSRRTKANKLNRNSNTHKLKDKNRNATIMPTAKYSSSKVPSTSYKLKSLGSSEQAEKTPS